MAGMELNQKQAALESRLAELGSVIVAYSGGVDSAYLAWAAHRVLGERMLAALADSASLARSHYQDALAFAEEQGIPLVVLATGELDREAYARNESDRCFHCKDELFTVLETERARRGMAAVAYGLNVDDGRDFRPGQRAAAEHRVEAPLRDAGLTKAEIRTLAQQAGLRLWDKPASACLASRIEYGRRVTADTLRQVEDAEEALRGLGLRRFRVRHHGSVARVEIAEEEIAEGLGRELLKKIAVAVRAAGFPYVAVDCDGYRSGSMNELLP
ncbi:MAG TPA: ATP-dependent sacrificial sulfur transferase LarE, partial [Terracidiphilus sp.]|nr:ATP-dependent sacrificial sulfur transferase LarE [Terracidiphilus sp.]